MTERRRHNRVRGIAVRVAVLLILGAVVNVAVAWGLAVRRSPETTTFEYFPKHAGAMLSATYVEAAFGELEISQSRGGTFTSWLDDTVEISEAEFIALLPSRSQFRTSNPALRSADNAGPNEIVFYLEHAFGWPVLTMQYVRIGRHQGDYSESDSIALPSKLSQWLDQREYRSELPVKPIWPGFVINTLFYATTLWLLFAAPGRVRRWRRIRRGLCAKCAYPIGTSEVCTECGAPVRAKSPR